MVVKALLIYKYSGIDTTVDVCNWIQVITVSDLVYVLLFACLNLELWMSFGIMQTTLDSSKTVQSSYSKSCIEHNTSYCDKMSSKYYFIFPEVCSGQSMREED